jgi:hypothetical protein
LLLPVKNNLGALATGLGFRLEQCIVSKNIVASRVTWDTIPVTATADQALAAANTGTTAHALEEAITFLRDELAAGPKTVKELKASGAGAGVA